MEMIIRSYSLDEEARYFSTFEIDLDEKDLVQKIKTHTDQKEWLREIMSTVFTCPTEKNYRDMMEIFNNATKSTVYVRLPTSEGGEPGKINVSLFLSRENYFDDSISFHFVLSEKDKDGVLADLLTPEYVVPSVIE